MLFLLLWWDVCLHDLDAHQVFDLMRKQEKTRLAELAAEKSQNEAREAHKDIVSNVFFLLPFS